MKWALVVVNLLATIAFFFSGRMAAEAHRAQVMSANAELRAQHVLIDRVNYDASQRLRSVAAAGGRLSTFIAWLGAGACLANAIAIGLLWKEPKR